MFEDQADALVNTVNCVGVMGKGVALEFKRRWPENFKSYKKLCDAKQLAPGQMFIFENGDMLDDAKPRFLINFPTKQHWRSKSEMSFIEDGLDAFAMDVQRLKLKSVALPPLGCGNGGLPWSEVKDLIEEKLAPIKGIEFLVYAPKEPKPEPEYKNVPLNMTLERAVLVKTIGEFEKYFGGHLTRISLQKIVYFLQAKGLKFGMPFSRNQRGPYSETLKDALHKMEEHGYINGYSSENPEICATQSAFTMADEFLQRRNSQDPQHMINELALLIEGYESPFGMELLASVHYLVDVEGVSELAAIVDSVQSWNEHKRNEFSPQAIETAFLRLKEDNLIH